MSLLRKIRLYANRCPYCGSLMRLYAWKDSPIPVPALTHVRICPNKHYLDIEHLSSREMQCQDEGGRVLSSLADVIEFPDLTVSAVPIHRNLNVPLRKPVGIPRPIKAPSPVQAASPVQPTPVPVPEALAAPAGE